MFGSLKGHFKCRVVASVTVKCLVQSPLESVNFLLKHLKCPHESIYDQIQPHSWPKAVCMRPSLRCKWENLSERLVTGETGLPCRFRNGPAFKTSVIETVAISVERAVSVCVTMSSWSIHRATSSTSLPELWLIMESPLGPEFLMILGSVGCVKSVISGNLMTKIKMILGAHWAN